MSGNFFTDNADLQHHFQKMEIDDVIWMREHLKEGDYIGDVKKAYLAKLEQLGALCAGKIAPRSAKVDAEGAKCENGNVTLSQSIEENLADLQKLGVNGVVLPTRYGGLNFPVTVYAMMIEMVSRADASLQTFFGLQSIAETVNDFASPDQKWTVLPGFSSGELTGAMVLTEPDAGSDLQNVSTTATEQPDGTWRINGIKHFITNGSADVLLVLARSEEGTRDGRGLSLFLVRKSPEVTIIRLEDKLGIHGSPTCVMRFKDAPAELIGKRRFGLIRYVMSLMNNARLSIGAQAVGIMEAIRKLAWDYCGKRHQFGKPLSEIKPVWEMLSRMDALSCGCRALLYETCKWIDLRNAWNQRAQEDTDDKLAPVRAKEFGKFADVLTPILKYIATEAVNQCAYDGIQSLGGRGYMREYTMERYYRDARITSIYEGTSQMQVVAATSGILKGDLALVLGVIQTAKFPECAQAQLAETRAVLAKLEQAQAAMPQESIELLSRRLVKGYGLALVALLLLRQSGDGEELAEAAKRFCWEFLPQAEAEADFILKHYNR